MPENGYLMGPKRGSKRVFLDSENGISSFPDVEGGEGRKPLGELADPIVADPVTQDFDKRNNIRIWVHPRVLHARTRKRLYKTTGTAKNDGKERPNSGSFLFFL